MLNMLTLPKASGSSESSAIYLEGDSYTASGCIRMSPPAPRGRVPAVPAVPALPARVREY